MPSQPCGVLLLQATALYHHVMFKAGSGWSAIGGGSSSGFVALLAVAVVGTGIYLASQRTPQRKPVPQEDSLPQVAALARAEKDAEWLRSAIRAQKAILGMTDHEVELAKGAPAQKLRDSALSESERARGGVEKWIYRDGRGTPTVVIFSAGNRVIFSSDVAETPLPGQAIRR